ncbi:alpha/beta-hydrolase [Dichomitus squalens LYAD-421 SS1]|uniref:alpha/beta-hydrolase n=1 Tax=Dichomitus squalens (strain LYAD-421) TaxID=732165 RepID=UPI0004415B35|nr:alpha/beta-hydrolase [Dichomitus squalens LYAD-421 SS1]EJF66902.1 alpha/beta-hydrolase [Dichomitus squalens LYAD-421 SS1]
MNLTRPQSAAEDYSAAAQKRKRPSQPALPILRWFSPKNAGKTASSNPNSPVRSRPPTPSASRSDTPGPSTPTTPPSALSALADAFADDPHLFAHSRSNSDDIRLPSRPAAARLQSALQRPSYFSNLTRTTMPTACLSPPVTAAYVRPGYTDPFEDPFAWPPRDQDQQQHSPPSSSSVEQLRHIHERSRSRSIHTSASQGFNFPQLPNLRSWFSSEEGGNGDKENLNPMLSDEDKAETAAGERENIRRKYVSTKNPLVFCHGLLGFDTVTLGPAIAPLQVQHWRGIRDALETNGIEVLTTRVPATSSPIDRAKVLCERIAEKYPGRAVHLIGHSMGGIDCRYLTTHLTDRPFDVLSVTTISSPHRGSAFADHFLETVGKERMPSVLALLELLPNGGGDGKAFEFLTAENMRRFNESTPDVPGVHYFSWGAVYEPGLIDTWKWPHSVVYEKEGPNDGLVSLQSAKWGTYLGTLEGVNHLDLVGWINTARYKWAEIMGREIKFKPATFYLGIADHLARVVEGQEQAQPEQGGSGSGRGRGSAERPERERERETSSERRGRERAEMADSLGKGEESSAGPSGRGDAPGAAGARRQSPSQDEPERAVSDVDDGSRALPEAQKRKQKEKDPGRPS